MDTIIQTVDVLVNVFLIFFLMKLVVNPREFYFNSALRPVDAVCEPVLIKLRRFFRPTKYGFDYTPLIAIICLLLVRLGVYWGLAFNGFIPAIVKSSQGLVQFLLSFFSFSIFVLLMVPVYSRNPLSSFLKTIVQPFEKPFKGVSQNSKTASLICAMSLVLLISTLLVTLSTCLLGAEFAQGILNWQLWIVTFLQMLMIAIGVYKFIVVLLIISVILSWMDVEIKHPVVNLVFILTEPILLPIRRLLPPSGGLDLTPWIACILIGVIGRLLNSLILKLVATILLP